MDQDNNTGARNASRDVGEAKERPKWRYRGVLAASLILNLFLIVLVALDFARPPRGGGRGPAVEIGASWRTIRQSDDAFKRTAFATIQQGFERNDPLRDRMYASYEALADAISADDVDVTKLEAILAELRAAEDEWRANLHSSIITLFATTDPETRSRYADNVRRGSERRKERVEGFRRRLDERMREER